MFPSVQIICHSAIIWSAEPRFEKDDPSRADENGREIGEALRNVSFPTYPVVGTINS